MQFSEPYVAAQESETEAIQMHTLQKGKIITQIKGHIDNLHFQAYLREALLEQHMRSHRGIKPFVCNECGLQFTVKSNWQRHVAEHTGTRSGIMKIISNFIYLFF